MSNEKCGTDAICRPFLTAAARRRFRPATARTLAAGRRENGARCSLNAIESFNHNDQTCKLNDFNQTYRTFIESTHLGRAAVRHRDFGPWVRPGNLSFPTWRIFRPGPGFRAAPETCAAREKRRSEGLGPGALRAQKSRAAFRSFLRASNQRPNSSFTRISSRICRMRSRFWSSSSLRSSFAAPLRTSFSK